MKHEYCAQDAKDKYTFAIWNSFANKLLLTLWWHTLHLYFLYLLMKLLPAEWIFEIFIVKEISSRQGLPIAGCYYHRFLFTEFSLKLPIWRRDYYTKDNEQQNKYRIFKCYTKVMIMNFTFLVYNKQSLL